MKRFLLWLVGVVLGVGIFLGAVMGVSYAFTTEGGCPDSTAQFGTEALEPNGWCWQVPLIGGKLDKVFASPATLTVQKLGTLYTAHPAITLPDWASYTTLTIQNAYGSIVFVGSVSDYQSFLFPTNGGRHHRLSAQKSGAGKARKAHRLVSLCLPVHPAGQRGGGAFRRAGGAGRHCGPAHLRHDRRCSTHCGDRPWQCAVRACSRWLAGLHPGGIQRFLRRA